MYLLTVWTLNLIYLGMVLIYSRINNKLILFTCTYTFRSKITCSIYYAQNVIWVVLWRHEVSINSIRAFFRHRIHRDISIELYVFRFFIRYLSLHIILPFYALLDSNVALTVLQIQVCSKKRKLFFKGVE